MPILIIYTCPRCETIHELGQYDTFEAAEGAFNETMEMVNPITCPCHRTMSRFNFSIIERDNPSTYIEAS